jgi:hypothetical protein
LTGTPSTHLTLSLIPTDYPSSVTPSVGYDFDEVSGWKTTSFGSSGSSQYVNALELTITADDPGPWQNPTQIFVDSVTFTDLEYAWDFSENAEPFRVVEARTAIGTPVDGTIAWRGP